MNKKQIAHFEKRLMEEIPRLVDRAVKIAVSREPRGVSDQKPGRPE